MSDLRSESMEHYAPTFSRLSAECIEAIVYFLGLSDIIALELTGNKALSSKLERSVTAIDAQMPCLSKWTFLPFRYPKLRSLSINRIKESLMCPFYAPKDRLIHPEGHATLERLFVRSPLATTLLGDNPPHASLYILLPSLKSLEIEATGRFTSEMLRNVPPTLTKFHLSISGLPVPESLPSTSLKLLPATLRDLSLHLPFYIVGEDETSENSQPWLPPSLTSLTINVDEVLPLILALPRTTECLRVTLSGDLEQQINSSLLPPFLTDLCIIGTGNALILDSPMPSTLTHASVQQTRFLDPVTGKSMNGAQSYFPPSLTEFQVGIRDLQNASTSFPNLRTFTNFGASNHSFAPFTCLTSLTLASHSITAPAIESLPTTLTYISTNLTRDPSWTKSFEKMTNLTKLHITTPTPAAPDALWKCMYSRLESLSCHTSNFETLKAFNGPWTRLTRLTLRASLSVEMSSDWRNTLQNIRAAKSLPKHHPLVYPQTLESLLISGVQLPELFWPPITRLPLLKILQLNGTARDGSFTPTPSNYLHVLKSLPPSLSSLSLHALWFVEPEYLQNLPKGLRQLLLSSSYGDSSSNGWTQQHIASLPPRLESLSVTGHSSLPSKTTLALPPTLLLFFTSTSVMSLKTEGAIEVARQKGL